MIKNIHFTVEKEDYELLIKDKGELKWREYVMKKLKGEIRK